MIDVSDWNAALEMLHRELKRHPIRNREPRTQMSGRKWHLIHERDGGSCYICGRHVPKGTGEVDHVIPRSSFPVEMLNVADRSDNLRVSCVECNQVKSNFETAFEVRTLGVTDACWECANPGPFDPEVDDYAYMIWREEHPSPEMTVPAYCGRCGHTWVPDAGWLL